MNEWTSNALLGKGSYVKGALSSCSEYFVRIGSTVTYFVLSWLNMRAVINKVFRKHLIQQIFIEKLLNSRL